MPHEREEVEQSNAVRNCLAAGVVQNKHLGGITEGECFTNLPNLCQTLLCINLAHSTMKPRVFEYFAK